jgi:uncharacterized membrane protein
MPTMETRSPGRRYAIFVAIAWCLLVSGYLAASATGQRGAALVFAAAIAGAVTAAAGWPRAGFALGLALAAAGLQWPGAVAFLGYVPPFAAFAFMGWFFGRTLRAGREPLITRVARREHADLPAELARYTRGLTIAWVLCFASLFAVALILASLLAYENWSRWVQGLGYVLPVLLLFGEYGYRRVALRRYPHAGLPTLLRNIASVMKAEALTGRGAEDRRGVEASR